MDDEDEIERDETPEAAALRVEQVLRDAITKASAQNIEVGPTRDGIFLRDEEDQICRVLRECSRPLDLEALSRKMSVASGFGDRTQAFYIWDVLKACECIQGRGVLRRLNPRASEGDARFDLRRSKSRDS